MSKISMSKLSTLMIDKRKEMNMTQEQLQEETGINRLQIGKIERCSLVPSVAQIESISKALNFSVKVIIEEDIDENVFLALRGQAVTKKEEQGMEELFSMMLCLKKHIVLRGKLIHDGN